MLDIFKESILVKKIYTGFIMFLSLLIIVALISYNSNTMIIVSGCFISISILSFLGKFINIKDWVNNNIDIPIYYAKVTLYLSSFLIIILMGYFDYTQIFHHMLMLSAIFLFGLFTFHCLTKEQKNSEAILASLKIFFSVFVLMSIMIYNTYKDAISLENELHKSEIEYALPKDKIKKLNDYNTFIKSQLKLFEPVKIGSNRSSSTNNNKKEPEFQIFMNVGSTIIMLTIIYCSILILNNLAEVKDNKNTLYKKKKTKF